MNTSTLVMFAAVAVLFVFYKARCLSWLTPEEKTNEHPHCRGARFHSR